MVVIDDREVVEHPEIPELLGLENTVLRLDAADYCFLGADNKFVGIERSEISNLVMKSRSGELESQMYKCAQQYAHVVLLVEGVYDKYEDLLALHKLGGKGYFRNYIYPRTLYSMAKGLEISLSDMGIEVVSSPNLACSMDVIRLIYKHKTRKAEEHNLFKRIRKVSLPVKMSANPAVPRLMALIPGVPEKVAIRLVHQYDSIWNVLHAEDKELLKVEGMGKTLVRKMRECVGGGELKD